MDNNETEQTIATQDDMPTTVKRLEESLTALEAKVDEYKRLSEKSWSEGWNLTTGTTDTFIGTNCGAGLVTMVSNATGSVNNVQNKIDAHIDASENKLITFFKQIDYRRIIANVSLILLGIIILYLLNSYTFASF